MVDAVLWRLARRPYALDRLGIGARDAGGRWNHSGTAVLYAARSVAVAALEKFVHVAGVVPPDLVLVRMELPDGHSAEEPTFGDLPEHWNLVPAGPGSMEFGTRWVRSGRSVVLYIPSVLVREERIAVVNPDHPEFRGVKMRVERDFHYDPRMFLPRRRSRRER